MNYVDRSLIYISSWTDVLTMILMEKEGVNGHSTITQRGTVFGY